MAKVILHTNMGAITLELDEENTPNTTANFSSDVQLSAGVFIASLSFLIIEYCFFQQCKVARGMLSSSEIWRNDKSV